MGDLNADSRDAATDVMPGVKRAHARGRGLTLLVAMFVMLVASPHFYDTAGKPTRMLNILASVVPLVAVYALSLHKWNFRIALALAIPAIASTWTSEYEARWQILARHAAIPLFYGYTTLVVCRYALLGGRFTDDKLFAAMGAYFLIGFTFAGVYEFIESGWEGHLYRSDAARIISGWDTVYYSFTTLTTLGYGDVLPVSDKVRAIAMLESVLGVLFIAVFVARLVGTSRR